VGIAVNKDGHLVYVDCNTKTVNLVKKKKIQEVVSFQEWMPLYVCSTTSGDLLVTMRSNDKKQFKVVRYTEFTETQTFQFDDKGKPLYSCGCLKYIAENRNLDICVADWEAKAVVVVSPSGRLRFRYTSHPSNTEQSFDPVGIATDSQGHLLIADCRNNVIHILDQDGQFLHYINMCGLQKPYGLCVDSKDNLFVAERSRDTVKKIRYK
jgi:DNA-binding beta-propeller fold protein YncE